MSKLFHCSSDTITASMISISWKNSLSSFLFIPLLLDGKSIFVMRHHEYIRCATSVLAQLTTLSYSCIVECERRFWNFVGFQKFKCVNLKKRPTKL